MEESSLTERSTWPHRVCVMRRSEWAEGKAHFHWRIQPMELQEMIALRSNFFASTITGIIKRWPTIRWTLGEEFMEIWHAHCLSPHGEHANGRGETFAGSHLADTSSTQPSHLHHWRWDRLMSRLGMTHACGRHTVTTKVILSEMSHLDVIKKKSSRASFLLQNKSYGRNSSLKRKK